MGFLEQKELEGICKATQSWSGSGGEERVGVIARTKARKVDYACKDNGEEETESSLLPKAFAARIFGFGPEGRGIQGDELKAVSLDDPRTRTATSSHDRNAITRNHRFTNALTSRPFGVTGHMRGGPSGATPSTLGYSPLKKPEIRKPEVEIQKQDFILLSADSKLPQVRGTFYIHVSE